MIGMAGCGGTEAPVGDGSGNGLGPAFVTPLAIPRVFSEVAAPVFARPAVDPNFVIVAPRPMGTGGYSTKMGFTAYGLSQLAAGSDPFCCTTTMFEHGGSPANASFTGTLPYDFPFFGRTYPAGTLVGFDSNGAITLGTATAAAGVATAFPSAAIPPATIAPMWGSLLYYQFSMSNAMFIAIDGVTAAVDAAGNYVVRFTAQPAAWADNWMAAEMTLFPTGRIQIRYASQAGVEATGVVNIGIQDESGTAGISPACAPNCFPEDGTVINFFPPDLPHSDLAITSTTVLPAQILVPETGGLGLPSYDLSVSYQVENHGTADATVALDLLVAQSYAIDGAAGTLPDGFLITFPFPMPGQQARAWSVPGPTVLVPAGGAVSGHTTFTNLPWSAVHIGIHATSADDEALVDLGLTEFVDSLGAIQVTTTALADATVGRPYSAQLTADTNGVSWTATGVPAGLSLSPAGVLSGTPSARGLYSITFTASEADYVPGSQAIYLRVN
jgi:hypothetical protein